MPPSSRRSRSSDNDEKEPTRRRGRVTVFEGDHADRILEEFFSGDDDDTDDDTDDGNDDDDDDETPRRRATDKKAPAKRRGGRTYFPKDR